MPRFLDAAVPTVLAAQRASTHLTGAYLAQAIGRRAPALNPSGLVGAAVRNGSSPAEVYRRPFVTLWYGLKQGEQFADALHSALARVQSTAAMDVQLTMRATAQAVQDEGGVYGYQRVADSGACPFCEAVDGAYVKSGDAFPLHDNCGCGLEPLTKPHARAAYLPTGEAVRSDYAIREHGELGLVLADPAHDFKSL